MSPEHHRHAAPHHEPHPPRHASPPHDRTHGPHIAHNALHAPAHVFTPRHRQARRRLLIPVLAAGLLALSTLTVTPPVAHATTLPDTGNGSLVRVTQTFPTTPTGSDAHTVVAQQLTTTVDTTPTAAAFVGPTVTTPSAATEYVAETAPAPAVVTPAAHAAAPTVTVEPGTAQDVAAGILSEFGYGADQLGCLVELWGHESGWRTNAGNPSGAYGIPQALPGSKMASVGDDWETNPATQIRWGLGYISGRYGSPCNAWDSFQNKGWY